MDNAVTIAERVMAVPEYLGSLPPTWKHLRILAQAVLDAEKELAEWKARAKTALRNWIDADATIDTLLQRADAIEAEAKE